jgi:xeroderma pigmentosum group C-complementing protein
MNEAISLETLTESARTRSGSRDVGAWLFTALLRSVGVETRLVCSLQPLQFGFLNEGSRQEFYDETQSDQRERESEMERSESHISISSTDTPMPTTTSSRKSGTRNPSFPSSSLRETGAYTNPSQYISDTKTWSPSYPFFWSEAWDVASQKWIAVEPMVAARVNQPSRIEPPSSAAAWESGAVGDNILTYVVGFDNSSILYCIINHRWFCKRCNKAVCQSLPFENVAE